MYQLLATDPRTMWAWSEYQDSKLNLHVSDNMAHQILSAIPAGDHVEVFGAVLLSKNFAFADGDRLPHGARFAARTFNAWIIPTTGPSADIIPGTQTDWYCSQGADRLHWLCQSYFSMAEEIQLIAFSDSIQVERFGDGAGSTILRLPDNPVVPDPPALSGSSFLGGTRTARTHHILADWHTAEDVALWHMREMLGFSGAQLTGGISDHGLDVEHPEAVAQVKMQATPIGSPLIQQLRGSRPKLSTHVFYSTSGYTRAAVEEASETEVALFTIGEDGTVRPDGDIADTLVLEGYMRGGGDDAITAQYVTEVSARIAKAVDNYGDTPSLDALKMGFGEKSVRRAGLYLISALNALLESPQIGSDSSRAVISHFRNADLKAAYFCLTLDLPYPGDQIYGEKPQKRTAADFY